MILTSVAGLTGLAEGMGGGGGRFVGDVERVRWWRSGDGEGFLVDEEHECDGHEAGDDEHEEVGEEEEEQERFSTSGVVRGGVFAIGTYWPFAGKEGD